MNVLAEILEMVELAKIADIEGPAPGRPAGLPLIGVPEAVIGAIVLDGFARETVKNAHEIKTAKRYNSALAVLRVDDRGVYHLPVLADESSTPYWRALNYRVACHYISAPDGSYKRGFDSEESARRTAAAMTDKGMPRIYAGFEAALVEKLILLKIVLNISKENEKPAVEGRSRR